MFKTILMTALLATNIYAQDAHGNGTDGNDGNPFWRGESQELPLSIDGYDKNGDIFKFKSGNPFSSVSELDIRRNLVHRLCRTSNNIPERNRNLYIVYGYNPIEGSRLNDLSYIVEQGDSIYFASSASDPDRPGMLCGDVQAQISKTEFDQQLKNQLNALKLKIDSFTSKVRSNVQGLSFPELLIMKKTNADELANFFLNFLTEFTEYKPYITSLSTESFFGFLSSFSELSKIDGIQSGNLYKDYVDNADWFYFDFTYMNISDFSEAYFSQTELGLKIEEVKKLFPGSDEWNLVRNEIEQIWIKDNYQSLFEHLKYNGVDRLGFYRDIKEEYSID